MVMKREPSGEQGSSSNPAVWLEEHGDYLFRYAFVRLQDRDIAEDLVQETLVAALGSWEKFQARSSVRTWLVGILKHKIIDYFRKSGREYPLGDLSTAEDLSVDLFDRKGDWKLRPAPWSTNPGAVFEQKAFWEMFLRCMADLPPRLAQVFALRELEGLKSEEICNVMKISTTNLWVVLYRARMRLRRCLEVNWFGQNAGTGRGKNANV
jgi:RNA polymerase sigma-70 factor (ECF subfamily)